MEAHAASAPCTSHRWSASGLGPHPLPHSSGASCARVAEAKLQEQVAKLKADLKKAKKAIKSSQKETEKAVADGAKRESEAKVEFTRTHALVLSPKERASERGDCLRVDRNR